VIPHTGEKVAVLYGSNPQTCPVRALQAWIATTAIVDGPLFRALDRAGRIGAGRLTARIVGERVKKIGARSEARSAGLRRAFAAQRLRDVGGARERVRSRHHARRMLVRAARLPTSTSPSASVTRRRA